MDRKAVVLVTLAGALLAAGGLAYWLGGLENQAAPSGRAPAAVQANAADRPGDNLLGYPALLATEVTDLDGRRQSIGQWQGKLLVINFWATWCAPCKEEMPYFDEIFRENAAKGLQIVGIAADPPEKVRQFQQQIGVQYPLVPDEAGALSFSRRAGNRLGVLPHTLVYSPSGELILNKLGQLKKDDLALIVRENLPKSTK